MTSGRVEHQVLVAPLERRAAEVGGGQAAAPGAWSPWRRRGPGCAPRGARRARRCGRRRSRPRPRGRRGPPRRRLEQRDHLVRPLERGDDVDPGGVARAPRSSMRHRPLEADPRRLRAGRLELLEQLVRDEIPGTSWCRRSASLSERSGHTATRAGSGRRAAGSGRGSAPTAPSRRTPGSWRSGRRRRPCGCSRSSSCGEVVGGRVDRHPDAGTPGGSPIGLPAQSNPRPCARPSAPARRCRRGRRRARRGSRRAGRGRRRSRAGCAARLRQAPRSCDCSPIRLASRGVMWGTALEAAPRAAPRRPARGSPCAAGRGGWS